MGTITCELEASYAATTTGDDKAKLDGKLGATIPCEQRRLAFATGDAKGKGRRLGAGDGFGGGTMMAGSWCRRMFLRRRANASMQVFVRTLAGKSLALDVSPYDTVDAVKARIQAKERVAAAEQRLVFAGRDLDDGGRTLAEYGVRKEANLFLHLRLRGGAGGSHCWARATAVGLLATVVAVAAALPYLVPAAAAGAGPGSLTLAFLLFVWGLAVGEVNLITAGTSGGTLSAAAQSGVSKAAAFARQYIAVFGPSTASSAATGIIFSGADPVLNFVCFALFLGAISLALFLVFAERLIDVGGRRTSGGTGTAVGLVAAVVSVGTALNCFPELEAGAGALTFALLLFLWSVAVAGANMIAAGVCLTGRAETLSCTVQSVLSGASTFARQNLGVLGVAAASSAAAGVILSAADADRVNCFGWFGLFLVAMAVVTIGVASCGR